MTAHRHMKDFGTTPEQLAEVAVIQRRHAARTPGAQQTKRSRWTTCSIPAW